jgi:hypothetical protein
MDDLRKEGVMTLNDRFVSLLKKGLVDLQEITDHGPGQQGYAETILLQ